MNHIGSIFAMAVCLAMSAYFSATETAFSSLNKTRLKVLADNGNKRAALALKLAENYDRLISTILIGNNIVNITIASIGTLLFVALYGDIGATISTVVVTLVVLLFGEITPKSIAKDAPERFAMFSAPFIRLWIWVLTPLNFLFTQCKKFISRFIKTDGSAKMSHEELLLFMEDVEHDGGIDENEGELLRNALEFGDLTAAEILTHRIELEAVDINESHEEIAKAFTQSRFSRLLVYRDTIDQVVGVLHQKDFYINGKMTDQPIAQIMTEPLFVYQHTKIRDILKMLQHQKSHIAVVVDDFGGTLGIVTMEDILEEIVGNILDEYDKEEPDIVSRKNGTYELTGLTLLDNVEETLGVEFDKEDKDNFDTLNGFMVSRIGHIPKVGEKGSVRIGDYLLKIMKVENKVIQTVLAIPLPKEKSGTEAKNGNEMNEKTDRKK